MKTTCYSLLFLLFFVGCSEKKNTDSFIEKTTGRYLFNANEVIEIHFEDNVMFAKWRGKENIKPLKVNDSTFYMSEMNEKFIFLDNPGRIELAEKTEHKGIKYIFKKLAKNEKTPSEYLTNNEFDKALDAYLAIKKKDSLNPTIQEFRLNRLGYQLLRENNFEKAIEIFRINTVLHPNKSNTFDSLGDAYWSKKDTLNAVINYKKALTLNSENRSALRFFSTHELD